MVIGIILFIIFTSGYLICDYEDSKSGKPKKKSNTGSIILGAIIGACWGFTDFAKKKYK